MMNKLKKILERRDDDLFTFLFMPKGNYFIMDEEQLVSNPYQEMQKEVTDEFYKKVSLTEKMINVKNNICEKQYQLVENRLEDERGTILRDMHETSSKLRYHVKLLDLDRRKNKIEVEKRHKPEKDYSYDEHQLDNSEKRLGVPRPCYYLEKNLKYPVRNSGLQETVTPTLAKARRTLQQIKLQSIMRTPLPDTRESSAKTSILRQLSARELTTPSCPSQASLTDRPVRKPFSAQSLKLSRSESNLSHRWTFYTQPPDSDEEIDEKKPKLPEISQSTSSLKNKSHFESHQRGPSGHKVKFAFQYRNKRKYAKIDAHIMSRSQTFYDTTRVRKQSYYSIDSDDDEPPPRKVDLRAVLFGKSPAPSRASIRSSTMAKRRRSLFNHPGHLTQEMLEKESAAIQEKIDMFLTTMSSWDPCHETDSDTSSEEEEVEPPQKSDVHWTPFSQRPKSPPRDRGVHRTPFSQPLISDMKKLEGDDNDPFTLMPKVKVNEHEEPNNEEEQEVSEESKRIVDKWQELGHGDKQEISPASKRIRNKWQDAVWRITKPNATANKNVSTEDLILQRLMGVNVSMRSHKKKGVPLNSAGRALRHTATFKMQKVVEDLMAGRTKFQQFEIDTLKEKLESGIDIAQLDLTMEQNKTSADNKGSLVPISENRPSSTMVPRQPLQSVAE